MEWDLLPTHNKVKPPKYILNKVLFLPFCLLEWPLWRPKTKTKLWVKMYIFITVNLITNKKVKFVVEHISKN